MIRPFWKTIALGILVRSALYLICFPEPSSAELRDPFAVGGAHSELAHYSPKKQVAGAFKLQGSDALYPLLTRLSADFQKFQPKVNIDLKKKARKRCPSFCSLRITKPARS